MRTLNKPKTLFAHPFSKEYWTTAALEFRDSRMLILAAMLIALRVALKPFTIIIMPNVQINSATFINALGAMIFGPVVAILAAAVSDTLGCILFPQGVYFFPFIFEEIAGSVIFALFLYRAKVTPLRVVLARFCIDFFVNILMNAPIMYFYYKLVLGKSYIMFQLPQILKNLFMFPVESVLITLFLAVLIPVTYRLGITYDSSTNLRFSKKEIVTLILLFCVGVASIFGYLFYYYGNTSISASYSADERYAANVRMREVLTAQSDAYSDMTLVTTIDSAYRKFPGTDTTYNVVVYRVDEDALAQSGKDLEAIRAMSKSKAKAVADEGIMEKAADYTIVIREKTGEILSCAAK